MGTQRVSLRGSFVSQSFPVLGSALTPGEGTHPHFHCLWPLRTPAPLPTVGPITRVCRWQEGLETLGLGSVSKAAARRGPALPARRPARPWWQYDRMRDVSRAFGKWDPVEGVHGDTWDAGLTRHS